MDNFEHFMGMIETGGIDGGRIDIVMSCVDNFQARQLPLPTRARTPFCLLTPPPPILTRPRHRPRTGADEHQRGVQRARADMARVGRLRGRRLGPHPAAQAG